MERTVWSDKEIEEEREKDLAEYDGPEMLPGSYGCHEALHMAGHYAAELERNLAQHPAVLRNPQWHRLAFEAAMNIADLYAAIGSEHLEAIPEYIAKSAAEGNG